MEEFNKFVLQCSKFKALTPISPMKQVAPSPKRNWTGSILQTYFQGYALTSHVEIDDSAEKLSSISTVIGAVRLEGAFAGLASRDLEEGNGLPRTYQLLTHFPDRTALLFQGLGAAMAMHQIPAAQHPEITQHFWGWQALDCYGFYNAYFSWPTTIMGAIAPPMSAAALRAFDHGVGRSIWSISAADPVYIEKILERFPPHRKADLWSGLGIMVGAFGMTDERDLKRLFKSSGRFARHLQQGTALGIMIQENAGECSDFGREVSSRICKASFDEVATMANATLQEIIKTPMTFSSYSNFKQLLNNQLTA